MVDQLALEYADRPVLFLEQDVDNPLGGRDARWWAGYGGSTTVFLPVAMVDSGHQVTNGNEDFQTVYSAMVDTALLRPALARLEVDREQVGNVLDFSIELTNLSGVTLDSDNGATVYAMVYEDLGKATSSRIVKAVALIPITGLEDGETETFSLQVALTDPGWANLPAVVFTEYRPMGSTGAWDMLQAVVQR